ncbi:MAG: hypothetical protein ABH803_03360 [Candidatus Micrarchaeota archaeon]
MISKQKGLFIVLFGCAALLAMQVNFSKVLGTENQYFTLFQFFAPIAGGFLGGIAGAASILIAQTANTLIFSKPIALLDLLRFTPMLFAAFYFGSKQKEWAKTIIPLAAIALFWLHPTGSQAWAYALFWTIPLIAFFFKENLFAKSLGATFTAHAVGSVIWLYTLQTTPEFWLALVPIVVYERLLFASGIAVSFVAFNSILHKIESVLPKGVINIDKRYVIKLPA